MRKYTYKILLGVFIAAQIIFTVYAFTNWKDGLHSDEVWCYGFANSYYHPFLCFENGISLLDFDDEDIVNWEKWVPGNELWEYITVQKGERFAYGSVYYNNIYDMHPPLYYMLLHTVCSFFPESFSVWYGESLNLLFLVLTQIFLFLTVRKVTGKEFVALATCLLYGGSMGALLTFTFIRQYSLALVFCMMFTYFSACFYDELIRKHHFLRRYAIGAGITACLAFLSHYYGILFIGVFTACFCVYLLLKRKVGAMLTYGFSMLIALGTAFAIYPAVFRHVFGDWKRDVTSYSAPTQFRLLLNYLFQYNYGFGINYFPNAFWNITLPILAAGIVTVIALLFPFRHETWFLGLIRRVKGGVREFGSFLRQANYTPIFALTASLAIFIFVARGVDVLLMGTYVIRYITITIPFFAMTATIGVEKLLNWMLKAEKRVNIIIVLIIGAILLRVNLTCGYPYIYPQVAGKVNLVEETADSKVAVVDRTWSFFITDITFFTQWLYKTEGVCFTSRQAVMDTFSEDGGLDGRDIDYMIVDTEMFRLSDSEKAELEARGGVKFEPEDANPHEYVYTDELKRITGNRSYEILAIQQGQRATYLVIKFE